MSERTVHGHLSNIFDKLGAGSPTDPAAYAFQHSLVVETEASFPRQPRWPG